MLSQTPISHWVGFHIFVVVLLACELIYASRRSPEKTHSTAVAATILWITAALSFAGFIYRAYGGPSTTQYLAGYAIEETLSVDNLFVFLLLFRAFRILPPNQPKVLFWGVAGAIVMRGAFIAAGIGLLTRFSWISYVFASILLYASVRLVLPSDHEDEAKPPTWINWVSRIHPVSLRQDSFFVRENGRPMMSVLGLALIAIEFTDIVFALDSIPAVLSITTQPFLAYTSNIMAVMGLRSLFFLLAHLLNRLRYLHYGLAAVLAFAALKMIAHHWIEIGPLVSLGVIVTLLGITILLSLLWKDTSSPAVGGH